MHVVNKNIWHNGKHYAQGTEIKEGDPGFKDLKQSGHVNVKLDDVAPAPVREPDPVMDLEDTQPMYIPQSVVDEIAKPEVKKRKQHRK
jgi:hypothetical protein